MINYFNLFLFVNSFLVGCLVAQPNKRLTITELIERLAAIAESLHINPSECIPVEKPVFNNQNSVIPGNF